MGVGVLLLLLYLWKVYPSIAENQHTTFDYFIQARGTHAHSHRSTEIKEKSTFFGKKRFFLFCFKKKKICSYILYYLTFFLLFELTYVLLQKNIEFYPRERLKMFILASRSVFTTHISDEIFPI